jgi:hypothetical protein
MKNVRIVSHMQRLDAVIARLKTLPDDAQIQSDWAKYVCVLVSGFLEQSVQTLCVDYARTRCGSTQVTHFVAEHVAWFQNAKMEKLLTLLWEFDPKFRETIENDTRGKLADAVNSVVQNRNLIAHGQHVGMSPATIIDWYKSVVTVIDKVEAVLS